jgi:hypothetical protein
MRDAIYNTGYGKFVGPGHHLVLFHHYRDKLPFAEELNQESSTIILRFGENR